MYNNLRHLFSVIGFFLITLSYGQATYYMTDGYVEACEGIIKDSEKARNGNDPTWYDHNEDYVFTICIPGTDQIELSFTFFQLEDLNLDVLSIYGGPDINSPLLGTFTGRANPGTIISPVDCITLHFVSDASVSAPGWEAQWFATPPEPIAPVFDPIPDVNCGSNSVILTLDNAVDCAKINPGAFSFNGPTGSIQDVVPLNCVNGKTNTMEVFFNGPLDESGRYNLVYSVFYTDICDNIYSFDIPISFDIRNCPLEISIQGPNTVCEGSCATLVAVPQGGDFLNYQYSWDNGLPPQKNVQVCPTVTTTYTVTVTDGVSIPSSASHTVTVLTPPISDPDFSLCWNDPGVVVAGTPAGGTWAGQGVDAAGNFSPAGIPPGIVPLVYYAPNGCTDTTFATILDGWAGLDLYACEGGPVFTINGRPAGGAWSGTNITATGDFTPNPAGTYDIVYTAPTGCVDSAIVEVDAGLSVPPNDTTCVNGGVYTLTFNPPGGFWSGPGIQNAYLGRFNPANAGIGTHTLVYSAPGCSDTTIMEVINVQAGVDTIVCPSNSPFNLVGIPSGGVWTGNAVTGDSFDPGFNGGNQFFDTLFYNFNGCSARKIVYVIPTRVSPDTLQLCEYDTTFTLNAATIQPLPNWGVWSGTGLVPPDRVDPTQLSPGINKIQYTANNCVADYHIMINATPVAQPDTFVCLEGDPFILQASPAGGFWFNHIDDPSGLFNPQTRGSGNWTAIYNLNGCVDTTMVSIQNVLASITEIPDAFCNTNTPFLVKAQPTGGIFSVIRNIGDTLPLTADNLVPSDYDTGMHTLLYQYGSGSCLIEDSIEFEVRDSLRIFFPYKNDTICFGDETQFEFAVTGGDDANGYEYIWEDPYSATNPVYLKPSETEYITVTVGDFGCSGYVQDSIEIFVHGEIWWSIDYGPKVCYGDSTWAEITMGRPTRDYLIEWFVGDSILTGDSIYTFAERYDVQMTDVVTGCVLEKSVVLPHHPFLDAKFTVNPEGICVTIIEPQVQFIENTKGAQSGTWDFGDGNVRDWVYQNNPIVNYLDTGEYTITLIVENGNGLCTDTAVATACVEPVETFFIENTFTPNNDGKNDYFPSGWYNFRDDYLPMGYLIDDYDIIILNRWGDEVYSTVGKQPKEPWNGLINNTGAPAPSDVYRYGIRVYFDGTKAIFKEDRVLLLR